MKINFLFIINMENINNNITLKQRSFFKHIQEKIEEPLYFYGSVQRIDYFNGKSDIDVCIFCNNIESTKAKLCNILGVSKEKYTKVIWLEPDDTSNKLIEGGKIKYNNTDVGPIEFSLFDIENKSLIIDYHKDKILIPWYASYLLFILKLLYYYTPLIPKSIFKYCKNIILSTLINKPDTIFVLLK